MLALLGGSLDPLWSSCGRETHAFAYGDECWAGRFAWSPDHIRFSFAPTRRKRLGDVGDFGVGRVYPRLAFPRPAAEARIVFSHTADSLLTPSRAPRLGLPRSWVSSCGSVRDAALPPGCTGRASLARRCRIGSPHLWKALLMARGGSLRSPTCFPALSPTGVVGLYAAKLPGLWITHPPFPSSGGRWMQRSRVTKGGRCKTLLLRAAAIRSGHPPRP